MRQDKTYADTANKNAGSIPEKITYDYFVDVFGKKNTYLNINILKGHNRITEIDVMGILGNTVVIAQNKSKKMTIPALSGDTEAIRTDFKKAVIDPYQQGILVRDVLLGDEPYRLEDSGRNGIRLPTGIERVYILCVTSEPYPAVMDQMRALLTEVDQLPPMQISLFDLDLMAEYLKDPYDFVFYLKQRLENHEGIISSSEIIHLGFHLKYGLFMPRDTNKLMMDQSFGQLVDADYYHRKMGTPAPKGKNKLQTTWRNNEYNKIVEDTKRLSDPKGTDIVFFLMTIPHNIADALTTQIRKTLEMAKSDRKYHDFSMPITNNDKPWGGITYIVGDSQIGTSSRLQVVAEMNKYRSKADCWLAIGARRDGNIGIMAYFDQPWLQTKEMDEALDIYTKNSGGKLVKIDYDVKPRAKPDHTNS